MRLTQESFAPTFPIFPTKCYKFFHDHHPFVHARGSSNQFSELLIPPHSHSDISRSKLRKSTLLLPWQLVLERAPKRTCRRAPSATGASAPRDRRPAPSNQPMKMTGYLLRQPPPPRWR